VLRAMAVDSLAPLLGERVGVRGFYPGG